MDKKITEMTIVLGLLGIILVSVLNSFDISIIIKNSIGILIICTIQLFRNLYYNSLKYLISIELLITLVLSYFNIEAIIAILPILLFDMLSKYINIFYIILANIVLIFIITNNNVIFFLFYVVVVNLYFYEYKNLFNNIEELKKSNRLIREDNRQLNKKLTNIDKYIEQNQLVVSLKERNYISQKMHDSLGHRITSSLMQLEVTKEIMNSDVDASKKHLINAMNNLKEGMDEIRSFLKNIKPREKVIGIEDIKKDVLKFQANTSIKTIFNVSGNLDKLRNKHWVVIQANIQEALTNCGKYSKATKVEISIVGYYKMVRVEIRDNGIGCPKIHKSLGLLGMEERINTINSKINFYNDKGFVINMIIIMEENNEH